MSEERGVRQAAGLRIAGAIVQPPAFRFVNFVDSATCVHLDRATAGRRAEPNRGRLQANVKPL